MVEDMDLEGTFIVKDDDLPAALAIVIDLNTPPEDVLEEGCWKEELVLTGGTGEEF